ncbi:MAG TPA: type II toxin-antitoxin system VapC family toxin [Tepidisphaeraceae bacterium]|nr:type II toxin-antitoxin system VapC family toxin [Tepidisphaeraceae bacterium]
MTHLLLDTNICSAHMRRPGGLAHRFFQHAGGLAVPTIVLAELYAGAYHHPSPERFLVAISDMVQELRVLEFDSACAEQFGKVRGELLRDTNATAQPVLRLEASRQKSHDSPLSLELASSRPRHSSRTVFLTVELEAGFVEVAPRRIQRPGNDA